MKTSLICLLLLVAVACAEISFSDVLEKKGRAALEDVALHSLLVRATATSTALSRPPAAAGTTRWGLSQAATAASRCSFP
ncbi:hypothetical protein FHG87_015536 [Trinorchestia longiramus]|nr:hypothetical protein FHG87_015536 [Trinorchestia longiramus]